MQGRLVVGGGANPVDGGADPIYFIHALKNPMELKKFWSGVGRNALGAIAMMSYLDVIFLSCKRVNGMHHLTSNLAQSHGLQVAIFTTDLESSSRMSYILTQIDGHRLHLEAGLLLCAARQKSSCLHGRMLCLLSLPHGFWFFIAKLFVVH